MPTKSKYQRSLEAQKCPNHVHRPVVHAYSFCKECLDKNRVATANYKARAKAKGFCSNHPKSPMPIYDGYTVCNSCLWKKREAHLRKMFDITIETYAWMEYAQDRKCAICKSFSLELCVDHCHETGKLRSLLCHKCNVGIGHFNDNADLLQNAIEYIKNWSK